MTSFNSLRTPKVENSLTESLIEPEQPTDKIKPFSSSSLFVMINCALICYAAMNTLGKIILTKPEGFVNAMEFCFFRSVFLCLTSYKIMARYGKKATDVPLDCRAGLILRSLVGVLTFIVVTVALSMIPLSIYTIVLSTTPLFTGLLLWVWLR